MTLTRPLAFFDLETTGLSTSHDRIIELAVLRISPNGDVLERVRRFNPEMPISPGAMAVHGITDEDLADEPPFRARAKSLFQLLEPCDLAGFNVRRFDLPMLVNEFKRAGLEFDIRSRKVLDMKMIFHREEPRDLSAAARFYLDREHEDAHEALGDIRTTAAVLVAQLERYPHLPRNVQELNAYCDEVGPIETELDRWFRTEDGERVFRRGKHDSRALSEVAATEPDYLHWMLNATDMDDEVKAVVREALDAQGRES